MEEVSVARMTRGGAMRIVWPCVSFTSTPRPIRRSATSRPVPTAGSMSIPAQSPAMRKPVTPWPTSSLSFASSSFGLQSAPTLDELKLSGDEATGANIVRVALEAPLKQIAFNSGLEPGVVAEKVRNLPAGHGLNAQTNEYEDLLKAGVADPVKVTRSALQNAASIAALFLTTEAVVADKPEKAAASMGDPTGGMGGMDF